MIYNKFKRNILSAYCSDTIDSDFQYGIINESSRVKLSNSIISGLNNQKTIVSYNMMNGYITFDNNIINNKFTNILSLNSEANVTNKQLNKSNKSYQNIVQKNIIQKGSIYNYPNPILTTLSSELFSDTKNFLTQQLNIPKGQNIKNKKYLFDNIDKFNQTEQYKFKDFLFDGSKQLGFSADYLTNGEIPYWSSIYKGFFTKDTTTFINTEQQLINYLNKISRNLNGHILTININMENTLIKNANITNFYNGKIQINLGNNYISYWNIEDNNCEIEININYIPIYIDLNDNKCIKFNIKYIIDWYSESYSNNFFIRGSNNHIQYYIENNQTILEIELLQSQNSFGNYIITKNIKTKYILQHSNGNMIFDSNSYHDENRNEFINHDHNLFTTYPTEEFYLNSFRINDVRPKKYGNACAIGTIVGWVKNNNKIPKGYYECNGSMCQVNSFNPNDEYYNAQLAYLLGINDNNQFQLPYISRIIYK